MKRSLALFFILLLLYITGCSVAPPAPEAPPIIRERIARIKMKKPAPLVRIGLVQTRQPVLLTLEKRCRIYSHDGTFIARGLQGTGWRVIPHSKTHGGPAYRLVASSMSTLEGAQNQVRELRKKGHDAEILPPGTPLLISGRRHDKGDIYRICLKEKFYDESQAREYKERIRYRLNTFLVQEIAQAPQNNKIILENLTTGEEFESTRAVYIVGGNVTVQHVPVGMGYHWASVETRIYPETIILDFDAQGRLNIINEIDVETYIKGVLPSEMPTGFPLEALKAQAVAARSEALHKIGRVHRNDPFDLCSDVHCQVYSGLSKRSPQTDKAADKTQGMVLWNDGHICDAVYSAVCGGHTEHTENVWSGDPVAYLRGVTDGPREIKRFGHLDQERKFQQWIDRSPNAWCNSTRRTTVPSMEYTKKYFRWTKHLTQAQLRQAITQYLGRDIGEILDLIPLRRGVSGRIIELKVVGSRDDVIIKKELNIRKALCDTTLWSAAFYTVKSQWKNRVPQKFILYGAGFGHGVGMCQTGAAGMALDGWHYKKILKYYYKGIKIKRLY